MSCRAVKKVLWRNVTSQSHNDVITTDYDSSTYPLPYMSKLDPSTCNKLTKKATNILPTMQPGCFLRACSYKWRGVVSWIGDISILNDDFSSNFRVTATCHLVEGQLRAGQREAWPIDHVDEAKVLMCPSIFTLEHVDNFTVQESYKYFQYLRFV